jgi:hypothetical protein
MEDVTFEEGEKMYDNGVHEHCVDDGCTNNTTDTTLDYMALT